MYSGVVGNNATSNNMQGYNAPVGGYNNMQGQMGGPMIGSTSTPQTMDIVEDLENEPPLLEELGVNVEHILAKTKAVLTPLKAFDEHLMDDTDLAGPLCFCLLLGFSLLLTGKVHFGYIYGFGVFGCVSMSTLVNLISPSPIDTWRAFSILGYCLLPVNFLSVIAIVFNLQGSFGLILAIFTISWCTAASTRLFERSCDMREQRWLIAYPTALLYSCFVMLTIF